MRMFLLIAALMLTRPAAALPTSAGSSGAQFLKMGVGARATGMGGACVATCADAYSLYWNPAGLSRITSRGEAVFFHSRPFGLLSHDYAAGTASIASWDSVLAAGVSRLGTSQKGYDAANQPTGDFATEDLALSLGGAKRFELFADRAYEDERTLRVGAAIKLIRQTMPGAQASGFATDLGLQGAAFENPNNSLRLGLSLLNLGPGMGPSGNRSPLPMSANLGVAWERRPTGLLLAAELTRPNDGETDLRLGLDWRPLAFASFRAGFSSARPANGPLDSLSLGGGLSFKSLEFGAALSGHAALGRTLLFDLKWRW